MFWQGSQANLLPVTFTKRYQVFNNVFRILAQKQYLYIVR